MAAAMTRTLIQGGWIVGFQQGHHAILRDGVVVYGEDRIVHVGADYIGAVDAVIPAAGKLVAPGFVNIHALANVDIQTLVLDTNEDGLATSEAMAKHGAGELELRAEQLAASARFSLLRASVAQLAYRNQPVTEYYEPAFPTWQSEEETA